MNITIISGRLGSDPELKTGGNGTEYTNLSVAVDRRKDKNGEKKTDWFRCAVFGKQAVFVTTYFKKGDGIDLIGRMENDPYKDKDGNNRDGWKLLVDQVEFPKGGKSGSASGNQQAPVSGFEPVDDDSLPF